MKGPNYELPASRTVCGGEILITSDGPLFQVHQQQQQQQTTKRGTDNRLRLNEILRPSAEIGSSLYLGSSISSFQQANRGRCSILAAAIAKAVRME